MTVETKFKVISATLAVTGSVTGALWLINKKHPNENLLTEKQASILGTITLLAFGAYFLDVFIKK